VPALTLKNLPDDLHERLKERAALHHRSLNSEVIACLRVLVMAERVDPVLLLATARRIRAGIRGRLKESTLREAKAAGRP
jgi:plasmid stability protein